MELLCLILSGFALLAALVNLILFFREKKRTEKKLEALMVYIDQWSEKICRDLSQMIDEARTNAEITAQKMLNERMATEREYLSNCFGNAADSQRKLEIQWKKQMEKLSEKVSDLEHGLCPDFNKAMAAKDAIDEFSAGVMSILTYGSEPARKQRKKDEEADD